MCIFIESVLFILEMWIWLFYYRTSHREDNLNGSGINISTQSIFCYVYKYTDFGNFLISLSIGEMSLQ